MLITSEHLLGVCIPQISLFGSFRGSPPIVIFFFYKFMPRAPGLCRPLLFHQSFSSSGAASGPRSAAGVAVFGLAFCQRVTTAAILESCQSWHRRVPQFL